MRKIVFVIEQLYGGGAERVTAALMNELCKTEEVHLISTYAYDTANDYPTDGRIMRHCFDDHPGSRAQTLLKRIGFLRRTICAINPMCVISLAACGTNALLTAALCGVKTPLILSERNDPTRFPTSWFERLLRLISYHLCEGLVFQTTGAQAYFPLKISKKSTIIVNPITGDIPARYEGIREQCIVNCCRLKPQKNLDLLIDAFADIADDYPGLRLEIYGEGPERQHLEAKISNMRLQDRILLPGYTQNAFATMHRAMMFVSSSDYEGISNSMLEALAIGTPTLCTDCPPGGARETITDGVNGLLVPTGDQKALAAAMRRLLDDPQLLEQISRNGHELRKKLSVGQIAQQWMAYLRKVCAGRKY